MYVKNGGQLKSIKLFELTSASTANLLQIESERGTEEVYKSAPESGIHCHLRKRFSSGTYLPSHIVSGQKDFLI